MVSRTVLFSVFFEKAGQAHVFKHHKYLQRECFDNAQHWRTTQLANVVVGLLGQHNRKKKWKSVRCRPFRTTFTF